MRILLSEGSGLTSRQVATRLGELGHEVEILSSTPLCLSRFTRHVRRIHPVPPFGREPVRWFEVARTIARERRIDVLFPTQEQVAVLSAMRSALNVATVVPPFESLCRVQDKISAYRTLHDLSIPQPASFVAKDVADLRRVEQFPIFLKRPISTASMGVRKVSSRDELEGVAKSVGLSVGEILVQTPVLGELAMVQAVADDGRLVAHHACLRVRQGTGGGAAIKESVNIPGLAAHVEKLVDALGWHGPLSMDVIVTSEGPMVIDINPRLVEPMNAYRSGVDLVGAVLDLACQRHPPTQRAGRARVRTRQLLLAVLGAAEREGSRIAIAREFIMALRQSDEYANAPEELTPVAGDWIAAVPVAAAALATIAWPAAWQWFHSGAVDTYSLTPEAWQHIRRVALA
ncbi:MAG: ATP-grasp domain-containing protein [Sulfurifustis sp.]